MDGVAVGHQQRVGGSLSRPATTSPISPTSTDAVPNQSLQKSELRYICASSLLICVHRLIAICA